MSKQGFIGKGANPQDALEDLEIFPEDVEALGGRMVIWVEPCELKDAFSTRIYEGFQATVRAPGREES